jgi:integrase
MLEKVITGGQTGGDQAGWRSAREFGIPTGGWMPLRFLTEDGPMASLRKRGRTWYFRYVDTYGVRHECKGWPDLRETEAMVAAMEVEASKIKAGLIDPKALGYRNHEARPLAEHLAEWLRDMHARGKTRKHARQYLERAGRLAAMVGGAKLADLEQGRTAEALVCSARLVSRALESARLSDLTPEGIQAALARLRDAGKSLQTVNHYRAALRAFVRWANDTGRLGDNPMRGVKGFNVDEDRRHERRTLTDEELAQLIRTAETGPERFGMSGPLRAMAYRLAAATGLRVAELRTLTPDAFRLDGPEPVVWVRASATKNRRPAEQPIPSPRARELALWLRDKPAGATVLPLRHETAKAIRADLESAGIPYATDEGVADFHSLRAYFVSALVRAGASIKEVQTLARHAKPQTTLNHYAKVSVRDLRSAVESLPALGAGGSAPEALAATGTYDRHISNCFAPPLPHEGDGSRRKLSEPVESVLSGAGNGDTSQTPVFQGFGRALTASDGSRTERGGFCVPLAPNRLPSTSSVRTNSPLRVYVRPLLPNSGQFYSPVSALSKKV